MQECTRLKEDRFNLRDADLKQRQMLRFMQVEPKIPLGYKDTATAYKWPGLTEEGRQVGSLIFAMPVPHIPAPQPQDQPLTTKGEQRLIAMHQELEAHAGSIWWKNAMSMIHADLGVIYFGLKRNAYHDAPKTPDDNASVDDYLSFTNKMDSYKKEAGISEVFDYRHVPTDTFYYRGDIRNPLAVCEIKEVDERDLMLQHGLTKDYDGKLSKPADLTTMPSGDPPDSGRNRGTTRKLKVIEYWDRNWCLIMVENGSANWRGSARTADALVLDDWEHNWGRVPYFAAPAFENEVSEEHFKFESPLSSLYAEIPEYNNRRTMFSNVSYLKSYPAWQVLTEKDGLQVMDDSQQPKQFLKPKPGEAMQMAPGQQIADIPMQTGPELFQELLAMEQRMKQWSSSDVAKGVSPGADTANSALSQLRRLQRASLSPMSVNMANQAREMYTFALKRVQDVGEPIPVYDLSAGEMVELGPEDIVTMRLQVKVAPDTGQDNLIEEKQAAELLQQGLITEEEFHERRGKENPEEFVLANMRQRLRMILEPQMQQQILAALGNSNAIAQLIAANQQTGDAKNAVPDIMSQISEQQGPDASGMGSGSGMMPRQEGVRSPAIASNTQPGPMGQNGQF